MKLEINNLQLPLAQFVLEVDLKLSHAHTGLFGPSGAGKTSLLETIAGLRKIQSGRIALDGEVFSDSKTGSWRPVRHRRIGYVPQDDSLFPHLSVRQNLLYGRRVAHKNPVLTFERVISFLAIAPLLDRDIRTLSRGENQRIVIARALLSAPRLLLLDEPLTGLDVKLKTVILEQLRSLPNEFGVPMIYVTHDPAEAIAVCDEIVKLEVGKIIDRGEPRQLLL